MVGVEPDIFEIVVFASGTDTFLGIGSAGGFVGAGDFVPKDGDKLVDRGVGEEEAGRFRQEAGGRHNAVAFALEEIEVALTDLGGSHKVEKIEVLWPKTSGEAGALEGAPSIGELFPNHCSFSKADTQICGIGKTERACGVPGEDLARARLFAGRIRRQDDRLIDCKVSV